MNVTAAASDSEYRTVVPVCARAVLPPRRAAAKAAGLSVMGPWNAGAVRSAVETGGAGGPGGAGRGPGLTFAGPKSGDVAPGIATAAGSAVLQSAVRSPVLPRFQIQMPSPGPGGVAVSESLSTQASAPPPGAHVGSWNWPPAAPSRKHAGVGAAGGGPSVRGAPEVEYSCSRSRFRPDVVTSRVPSPDSSGLCGSPVSSQVTSCAAPRSNVERKKFRPPVTSLLLLIHDAFARKASAPRSEGAVDEVIAVLQQNVAPPVPWHELSPRYPVQYATLVPSGEICASNSPSSNSIGGSKALRTAPFCLSR